MKVLHQILMTVLAHGSSRKVCTHDINGTAQSGAGSTEEEGGGGDAPRGANCLEDWGVRVGTIVPKLHAV